MKVLIFLGVFFLMWAVILRLVLPPQWVQNQRDSKRAQETFETALAGLSPEKKAVLRDQLKADTERTQRDGLLLDLLEKDLKKPKKKNDLPPHKPRSMPI